MDNIWANLIVGYVLSWLLLFANEAKEVRGRDLGGVALYATIVAPLFMLVMAIIFGILFCVFWAFGEVFG